MKPTASKPVIGLVGGIGGGKSVVAELLAEFGGRIVSGDALGHEALMQPAIRDAVVARWGDEVLDESGKIVRRRLGKIVFADDGQRRELEAMVFPWIERRIREELAREEPEARFVILDAAIMMETGWNNVCDKIVYIHTPRPRRLARLHSQRGWDEAELARRESAQLPVSVKEARADRTLLNEGTPEQLREQVTALLSNFGILPDPVTLLD